ncbi:hypothetical protein ACTA71_009394 [Dictyostelium dimigraforme]
MNFLNCYEMAKYMNNIDHSFIRYHLLTNESFLKKVIWYIRINSNILYNQNNNNNNNNKSYNFGINEDDESEESTDEETEGIKSIYNNNRFQTYGSDGEWDGETEEENDDEDGELFQDDNEVQQNEQQQQQQEEVDESVNEEMNGNEEIEMEDQYDSGSETGEPTSDNNSGIMMADDENETFEIQAENEENENEEEDNDDDDNHSYYLEEVEFENEIGNPENHFFNFAMSLIQDNITIPAKTIFCQHNECFDLRGYLIYSCVTGTWNCPVCHVAGKPPQLVINFVLERHIKKNKELDGFILIFINPKFLFKINFFCPIRTVTMRTTAISTATTIAITHSLIYTSTKTTIETRKIKRNQVINFNH